MLIASAVNRLYVDCQSPFSGFRFHFVLKYQKHFDTLPMLEIIHFKKGVILLPAKKAKHLDLLILLQFV